MNPITGYDSGETIQAFRRFNRFYTRLLGLFNRHLLGTPLSLAEARTLFEINVSPGVSAAALSRGLGMDRGQLSRILSRLLKQDLIERRGSPAGRKALPLYPTPQGRRILKALETAADIQAAKLIGALDERKSTRLQAALSEVEALLEAQNRESVPDQSDIRLREVATGDLGWIVTRHAEVYEREFGFTQEFETYVLLGLAEYVKKDRSGSRVWIAEHGSAAVGSIGIVELPRSRSQLRWLLVEPHARGLGVGRKLVDRAVSFCRKQKYHQVLLWTLKDLTAARTLYASFGFELTEEKKGIMGGRPMIEECWTLTLADK